MLQFAVNLCHVELLAAEVVAIEPGIGTEHVLLAAEIVSTEHVLFAPEVVCMGTDPGANSTALSVGCKGGSDADRLLTLGGAGKASASESVKEAAFF